MRDREGLLDLFEETRRESLRFAERLPREEWELQGMSDVSPPKWKLAHESWFFDVILDLYGGRVGSENEWKMFNSYYKLIGDRWPRPERHAIPVSADDVLFYRERVDDAVRKLVREIGDSEFDGLRDKVLLGINHEWQHDELFFGEVLYNRFKKGITEPYFVEREQRGSLQKLEFVSHHGGVLYVGASDSSGFAFDNEKPRHSVLVNPFRIANRLVTNGEYLAFVESGGYDGDDPQVWLDAGWEAKERNEWTAPLYWRKNEGMWEQFSLAGWKPLELDAPVTHVNFYEADAFARWSKARLPREHEWEVASEGLEESYGFRESGVAWPMVQQGKEDRQFFGNVWQWTMSEYVAYPGYKTYEAPLTEYNSKWRSSGLKVMKGGSIHSKQEMIRPSYRDFWSPETRWQKSGIRLVRDL